MSRRHKGAKDSPQVIIRRPSLTGLKTCAECSDPVGMLTPEEAAAVADVSTRAIYRWVEEGAAHFTETPEGLLLICLNSLAAKTQKTVRSDKNSSSL